MTTAERKIKSLSWSKINSFLEYRNNFIKTYFEEEPFFETKEILFGKVMSAILELNSFDFSEILEHLQKDRKGEFVELEKWKIDILSKSFENIVRNENFSENLMIFQFNLFPDYEKYLQKFVNNICCLGFLDNAKSDLTEFREFKTGKKEWDQERAENHGQIYFYAMLIEAETGKLPNKAYLDWIVTEDDEDGIIKPTGEIKTFEVLIDKKKVEKMKKSLPKIFDEMQELYEKWLQDAESALEVDESIFEEFARLNEEKNELEKKLKLAKEKVDEELQKRKLDNHKIDGIGSFYYQTKKVWKYDEKINEYETSLQEKIKTEEEKIAEKYKNDLEKIAEMKKEFEENNEAFETKTLSFRAEKKK